MVFTHCDFIIKHPPKRKADKSSKFIVAAGTNGVIARFKVDGTRDETFNAPLISPAVAHSVVVQPDGKIPKGVLLLNSNG